MSVTVYGASDDLIEIDGDVIEEFPAGSSDDGDLVVTSNGTILRVKLTNPSVWRVQLVAGEASIVLAPENDEDNYSDVATVPGDVEWVVLGSVSSPLRSVTPASVRAAPTPDEVLACSMDPAKNGASASTVRGYLVALLSELWREEEGFSGKRPFGDSGWAFDVYLPLIQQGLVSGKLDEDGYVDRLDQDAADALVMAAIARLGEPDG